MRDYSKVFFDVLRRFAANRTVAVPALCAIAALIMHIRGLTTTDAQMSSIQHEVAAILDILFIVTGQSSARFSLNSEKICKTDAKADIAQTQAAVVKNKTQETVNAFNTNMDILDPHNPTTGELVRVNPVVPTYVAPITPEPPCDESVP
jgi:hypothetical protein